MSESSLRRECIRLQSENEQLRAQLVAMDAALEDASPEIQHLHARIGELEKMNQALRLRLQRAMALMTDEEQQRFLRELRAEQV